MEIKVGEKYLWNANFRETVEVEVLLGVDPVGCCCVVDSKGILSVADVSNLKSLRTPEEVELDKLCAVLKDMGVTADRGRMYVANYILQNFIRKDDPRVVEPLDLYYYTSAMKRNATPSDCFNWLKDNKHICVKED